MWSWSDFLVPSELTKKDHSSYNGQIKTYISYQNPYGIEVLIRQSRCDTEDIALRTLEECTPSADIQHYLWLECIDRSVVKAENGSWMVYAVFRKEDFRSLEKETRHRASNYPTGFVSEEDMWTILQTLVTFHAGLLRNVKLTQGRWQSSVKPQHIYFNDDLRLKIGEFGYGTKISMTRALNSMLPYASPLQRRGFIQGLKDIEQIPQNVAKSNVYSLGVCLAYLSMLEFPHFMTSLRDLQKNIDRRMTEVINYSAEWVQMLRKLMIVDEATRQDFVQIEKELPVLDKVPKPEDNEEYPREAKIVEKVILSSHVVITDKHRSREVIGMVRLTSQGPASRPAGYILCCVDMTSRELFTCQLIKSTLLHLVNRLTEADYMRIYLLSDPYRTITRWVSCNPLGRETLCAAIHTLSPGKVSKAESRIFKAMEFLRKRRRESTVTSLLILSDSQVTSYLRTEKWRPDYYSLRKQSFDIQFSIHTFAYSDIPIEKKAASAKDLAVLARLCHGSAHVVHTRKESRKAASIVLSRIFTPFARRIRVSIVTPRHCHYQCRIERVYIPGWELPDLLQEDQRSVLFRVKIAPMRLLHSTTCSPGSIQFNYIDRDWKHQVAVLPIILELFPGDEGYPFPPFDRRVKLAWTAVKVGINMWKAVKRVNCGNTQAAVELLERRLAWVQKHQGAESPQDDLKKAIQLVNEQEDLWRVKGCVEMEEMVRRYMYRVATAQSFEYASEGEVKMLKNEGPEKRVG